MPELGQYPDHLKDLLFLSAIGAKLTGLALIAAWQCREKHPVIRRPMTQRQRYIFIVIAVINAYLFMYRPIIGNYGLDQTIGAIGEMRQDLSDGGLYGLLLGWSVMALNFLLIAAPVLAVMVAVVVYRMPSRMAKGVWFRRGYVQTTAVRDRRRLRIADRSLRVSYVIPIWEPQVARMQDGIAHNYVLVGYDAGFR